MPVRIQQLDLDYYIDYPFMKQVFPDMLFILKKEVFPGF